MCTLLLLQLKLTSGSAKLCYSETPFCDIPQASRANYEVAVSSCMEDKYTNYNAAYGHGYHGSVIKSSVEPTEQRVDSGRTNVSIPPLVLVTSKLSKKHEELRVIKLESYIIRTPVSVCLFFSSFACRPLFL